MPPGTVDFGRLDNTFCSHATMREMRAAVIGAGSLGSEVIRILGLLGIGSLAVIDPDRVEATNLTRAFLLRNHLGINKAKAIAESCQSLFPDTQFEAFPAEVADVGFSDLRGCTVLFSCVDNDLARTELAYISTRLAIPVVDGGLAGELSAGRVSYFPGTNGACYSCLLTSHKRRELLTLWESSVGSCGAREDGDDAVHYASTPMMASVVAAFQVETALRQKSGGAGAFSLEIRLSPEAAVETLKIPQGAVCPFHDQEDSRVSAPGDEVTVGEYLEQSGVLNPLLVLDWPVCVGASCRECDFGWAPMQRLGFLRRYGACPQCGSDAIRTDEVVTEIGLDSPWVNHRFPELGLSGRHEYTVRPVTAA